MSATSNKKILKNITHCDDIVAYPAFGPQIHPKLRGEYGQLGIDTIIIDDMPDTLIFVSQLCEGARMLLSLRHRELEYSSLILYARR